MSYAARRRKNLRRGREYPLGQMLAAYLLALAAWCVATVVLQLAGLVLGYIVIGCFLARYVSSTIHWHPIYDTVGNVAAEKWHLFAYWPLAYPRLLVQLAICRWL